jgi:hypothetical protein
MLLERREVLWLPRLPSVQGKFAVDPHLERLR